MQKRAWKGWLAKCSSTVHCNGGLCQIVCQHRSRRSNQVTRFFHKLGPSATSHMRNILLEVCTPRPDADVLVSAVQNVAYYFPDIQNLEIKFRLGTLAEEMDKDTWTRILCCLVRLESCLPKGGHLRVKGIERHTELQCGWARRSRGWHD